MATIQDALITPSLRDLNIVGAVDAPEAEDSDLALYWLNVILDAWNADLKAVYTETFADFVFTPNLSPHTIGPTGATWTAARPVSLEWASVGFNNVTPELFTPIDVRDYNWYKSQPVPAMTMTFPTDVYYQADYPNGKLYFYGVPTVAYACRLWYRTVLAAVTLATTLALPPGYQQALLRTLEEALLIAFKQPPRQDIKDAARAARALVFENNIVIPRVRTQDSGMPSPRLGGGNFDWRSRTFTH